MAGGRRLSILPGRLATGLVRPARRSTIIDLMTAPPPRRRSRSIVLVALLASAMAVATYPQGAMSVLSRFIIDEFDLSRSQLGAAFTVFSLTGAVASPVMGILTDRGVVKVMAGVFAMSGIAVLVVASAPSLPVLLAGAVVGGLALGAGNPVTNRVVSERIGSARRGLAVGLKQAGPPLALLVAGVVLPPLALMVGWRWALAASAVIPVLGLIGTPLLLGRGAQGAPAPSTRMSEETAETRSVVWWLTIIGLGVALSVSAVIAFVPLYAQERVGASPTTAGSLAATMGLAGMVGRIAWGSLAGRFARPSSALLAISVLSIGTMAAITFAQALGLWALWLGVAGVGASMMAWQAVAWLVIIDRVKAGGVGKASAIMQVGNGVGFAGGPLLTGMVVDATGSYPVAWAAVGAVVVVTGLLTAWIRYR
jgi:predicted MFS family arabinose efflux permease